MSLSNLKNLFYRQEVFDGVVTSKRYKPPERLGIELGTLVPDYWYITVEDDKGRKYRISTTMPDFFDPDEINEGDKVRVKSARILGVYFRKVERR